jgi:5-formyltetrahydrofolate cyclo-ligase
VDLDELEPVDLVVTGCVAVGRDGARLGKGGGFSDLEFAVASAAGLISPGTVIATTVHDRQLVAAGIIPTTDHDVWVDLIVTPDETIRPRQPGRRAAGSVRWDELTDEKLSSIPFLANMRKRETP